MFPALAAIDQLLDDGYEFVTVKIFFKRRGVTPEAGKVYYDAKNNGINLSAEQISPEYYDEDKLAAHWGYDALCLCMERGWLTTDADGRWLPNHYVTRGALTAFGRFCGITDAYRAGEDTGYADVSSDDPDAPFIRWASDAGLMIGTGGQFSSDATLTREQLATVLARYLTLQGEAEVPALSLAEVYSDADAISGWAADGVARCTELGLLQGSGGAFHPKGTLTRAPNSRPFCSAFPANDPFLKEKRVEKVFSPSCSSSFPNLKTSENCLIERKRGFFPSFSPCSLVEDPFLKVLETPTAPLNQDSRRGPVHSVTTSTTVSVSPSIVKRTSSPSKLKP